MDQAFIGTILMFAGNFAPRNWAFCNGQLLSIAQNTALFSILGTTYGGDGQTTFALPDLRSRVPVHAGQGRGLSNYDLGQQSGAEHNTLTVSNMPTHTHPVSASMSASNANSTQDVVTAGASIGTPGVQDGREFKPTFGFNGAEANTSLNGLSVSVGPAGGSQPVNNVQPCLAVNYIICLYGVYPTRD